MNKTVGSISVILPNYNYAHFLKRRLDSIINQTVKPYEIIFLDDCSTDNSIDIARRLLNSYDIDHSIIPNESNQGIFKQWLKGISLAKGDYIWIAEADDYCELNFLEVLLPKFADENVVLAYSESMQVDEYQNPIQLESKVKENYFKLNRWAADFVNNGIDEILNYLAFFCTIPNISAVLMRKKAIDYPKVEIIQNYQKAGDWLFYILLLSASESNKLAYTANCLNYFTRHTNSAAAKGYQGVLLNKELLLITKYLLSNFGFTDKQKKNLLDRILSFMDWCSYDKESQDILFSLLSDLPNIVLMNEVCNIIRERDVTINKLCNRVKELEDMTNAVHNHIKEHNDIIKNLRNSTSWKLTKPMRFLGHVLRKLIKSLTNKK